MTTETTESAHIDTDATEVDESGSNLLGAEETGEDIPGESSGEEGVTETDVSDQGDVPFIPEEYRDNPRFANIKTQEDLIKAYAETGAPEAYEFAEGFDEGFAAAVTDYAKAADMSQNQVESMLGLKDAMDKAAEQTMWAEVNKNVEALKGEWGEEFDGKVASAKKAIAAFDNDGTIKKLMRDNPVMGNHPEVVKLFLRVAEAIDVDRFISSEGKPKSAPKDEYGRAYFDSYDKTMKR